AQHGLDQEHADDREHRATRDVADAPGAHDPGPLARVHALRAQIGDELLLVPDHDLTETEDHEAEPDQPEHDRAERALHQLAGERAGAAATAATPRTDHDVEREHADGRVHERASGIAGALGQA